MESNRTGRMDCVVETQNEKSRNQIKSSSKREARGPECRGTGRLTRWRDRYTGKYLVRDVGLPTRLTGPYSVHGRPRSDYDPEGLFLPLSPWSSFHL